MPTRARPSAGAAARPAPRLPRGRPSGAGTVPHAAEDAPSASALRLQQNQPPGGTEAGARPRERRAPRARRRPHEHLKSDLEALTGADRAAREGAAAPADLPRHRGPNARGKPRGGRPQQSPRGKARNFAAGRGALRRGSRGRPRGPARRGTVLAGLADLDAARAEAEERPRHGRGRAHHHAVAPFGP